MIVHSFHAYQSLPQNGMRSEFEKVKKATINQIIIAITFYHSFIFSLNFFIFILISF